MGSFEIKVAAANSGNNEGKRGFVSFKKTEKVHLPYALLKLDFQWFIAALSSCRRKFQLLCSYTVNFVKPLSTFFPLLFLQIIVPIAKLQLSRGK